MGVGLQLGEPGPGGWAVAAPLSGSPAEEAGVRRGSALVSVDGVDVRGLSRKQVEGLLRGVAGSVADLEIAPPSPPLSPGGGGAGAQQQRNQQQPPPTLLRLERRELPLPAVQWTLLADPASPGGLLQYIRRGHTPS